MTIERIENGQRFCRVLRHNGTVYLAGMTADDLTGDTTNQTEQVLANTARLIEPFLARLEQSRLSEQQQVLLDILRANITELTSPFASNFSTKLTRLTPAEIQVANLVKLGKRTKEIAEIMNLSPGTISIHRKNIRKKLELTHQKTNLQTMLSINS